MRTLNEPDAVTFHSTADFWLECEMNNGIVPDIWTDKKAIAIKTKMCYIIGRKKEQPPIVCPTGYKGLTYDWNSNATHHSPK